MERFPEIKALTFDIYGTVLDLGGSLKPFIARFLASRGLSLPVDQFWADWRARQRIEQFQDSLMMLGHSGYMETSRRACVYTMGLHGIPARADEVRGKISATSGTNLPKSGAEKVMRIPRSMPVMIP